MRTPKYEAEIRLINGFWRADTLVISKKDAKGNGKKISWKPVGTDVVIFFHPKRNPLGIDPLFIESGVNSKSFAMSGDPREGEYEYYVYCLKDGEFAKGESGPEMMIEP